MAKTKKYFRDWIYKDYASACTVFDEAMWRYGVKQARGYREALIPNPVRNHRNGEIQGFCYYKHGKKSRLSLIIYWQGDSTDGVAYQAYQGDGTVVAATEDHETISFTEEQQYLAMCEFANNFLK